MECGVPDQVWQLVLVDCHLLTLISHLRNSNGAPNGVFKRTLLLIDLWSVTKSLPRILFCPDSFPRMEGFPCVELRGDSSSCTLQMHSASHLRCDPKKVKSSPSQVVSWHRVFFVFNLEKVLFKAPASFPRQQCDSHASTVCSCGLVPEGKRKMTTTGHHSQCSITKPKTETRFKWIVWSGKNELCAPRSSSCHGFSAQGSYSFSRSDIFTIRS